MSSLHGFQYIGDRTYSTIERGFFLVAVIIAMLLSINFSYNVYIKWATTPVIIGINPLPTYIHTFPFPAVTICNMNQARASKVQNIDKIRNSILQILCGQKVENLYETEKMKADYTIFEDVILDVAQPCEDMFLLCRFGSVVLNCSDIFRQVLTNEGLCCAFNTVAPVFMFKQRRSKFRNNIESKNITSINWTAEKGYPNDLPLHFSPRVGAGTGSEMGLSVIVDANVGDYYCSSTNGAGFKILLHSPTETPNIAQVGVSMKVGHESRIIINPQINQASHLLRDISKDRRQCVFDDESNLSYFATYSRRNCELECDALLLADKCNCTAFFMPRINPDISVCGLRDVQCYDRIKIEAHMDGRSCSDVCIPSCFDLTYSPQVFSAPIRQRNFSIQDEIIDKLPKEYAAENIAILHFYYVDKAFKGNTKEQFIGLTEFLSNTGGLMGLFIGFSVISFVEVIYYGFIRPFFVSYRIKSHVKSQTVFPATYSVENNYRKIDRKMSLERFSKIRRKPMPFLN